MCTLVGKTDSEAKRNKLILMPSCDMSTILGSKLAWVGKESSPGDKRILDITILGSQGQASSNTVIYFMSFEQSELDSKYSLNVCVYSLHATWSVGLCCCMRFVCCCMFVIYVVPCVLARHGLFWLIRILYAGAYVSVMAANSGHSRQTWQVQQSLLAFMTNFMEEGMLTDNWRFLQS